MKCNRHYVTEVCICPTPPLCSAGLNSEFSFFETGCLIKARKSSLSYYGRGRDGLIPFPRTFVAKCNASNPIQDLNSDLCFHFLCQ